MKQKPFKKVGAAVLAVIMLLSTLFGAMAPQPLAAAAAEVTETEGFSAAFAGSYAKAGQPLTVQVQNAASDDIRYYWTVDGAYVGSDASYTPTEDDLMKWIAVTVTCGSDTAELEMFFSKLPVVYINTENGAAIVSKEEYINAELIIQGNETYNSDTTTLYSGATEIRGRGNSTWAQPKKPYRLKLDKKTDVFGMGKSKHWVLLANYLDESLQRNTLAYNLSGAMGMEQMSTVYVDVILNGDFVGNYQFCENIRVDDTRVDIFDWEGFAEDSAAVIAEAVGMDEDTAGDLESYMAENMGWITSGTVTFNGITYTIAEYPDIEIPSINGGYLIELDEYYDEVSKFKTDSNQPIMFKNPEFVNTNADMMAYVQTYIQAFEDAVQADSYTALYDGNTVHYSELFDFDALVDYWLINEIFFNEEINKKSTYMYKDIDGLMMMGPIWDMDWSSGGEGATYQTEQWATRYYSTNAQANQWYKYLIQDPWFFIKAQERYWEIRNAQVADMLAELDSSYELLKTSAAANGERWGYGSSYETYVNNLRNWFNNHLTWLDAQMATQDGLRDSLGYYPSSRLALTLTDAQGNALAAHAVKNAPADGTAAAGQALKLQIQGGNNTDGNAVLYVNGRRTSVAAMTANTTITVDVPAGWLTAPAGEKNVIEVQIEKADGTINASRYITVVTTDGVHEHRYEAVVTAPTCTTGGYTTYTCACGDSYVADETAALGHTEVSNPDTAPTFDDTGMTGGTKCEVCGEILTEPELIPMLDYNEGIIPLNVLKVSCGDWQTGYEATEGPAELVMDDDFSTIWHTDWEGTSRDDHWIQFELTEDYEVDGLRYKPRIKGSNGTITKYEIQVSDDGATFRTVDSGSWDGNSNWKVVSFEGEQVKYVRLVALDALSDNKWVFASAAEIRLTGEKAAAHEHHYEAVVTAPTCTTGGYTTYTCACGHSYVADETAALGHTEAKAVIENNVAATCTEAGSYDSVVYCSVCDAEISRNTVTVPATGHTAGEAVIENNVAPTCTEAGSYDSVVYCSVCAAEISRNTVTVPALGHNFVDGKCTRCGEVEGQPFQNPFVDVSESRFYYNAVLWAAENGIVAGTSETYFSPEEGCTRAQAVTFLWRAAGRPAPKSNVNLFVDLRQGSFYYDAVLWAVEEGIVAGVGNNYFAPEQTCTRGQIVTFLYRFKGKPQIENGSHTFTDLVQTAYYYDAVLWAVEKGITAGVGGGHFAPNQTCTRGQIVTFLYRAAR